MGAFLLPAALFFMAATIHKREGSTRLIGTLGGMTIAVMSLTVFLTLQWKYWPYSGSLMLTGGAFGAWVAEGLVKQLGSSIVSLLVFCLAIALSTPVSVARWGAAFIRASAQYGAKLARIVGTYLLYLLGLLAMRLAHAAGDVMQKLIEAAIRRARERAAAVRELKKAPIEVVADVAKEKREPSEPEMGLVAALPSAPPILTSGAKDVLAEIEEKPAKPSRVKAAASEAASAQGMPEILPHESPAYIDPVLGPLGAAAQAEHDGHGTIEGALAHKISQKLAKAKSKVSKFGDWKLPLLEFLKQPPKIESSFDKDRIRANAQLLVQKLKDFDIEGEITAVRPGPVITLYEFKPAAGVKVSRIANLVNDLTMAISAQSVRILAPIPGKSVVGIEIPSDTRETVYMKEFLDHPDFASPKFSIPVVMGKDIGGQVYLSDLSKMPHLLAAGQTGSGKSVFMNGLITSMLYRYTPDELRMILIDPKVVEFTAYADIPHLLLPVVEDPKNAATALRWAVQEMERRYRIMRKAQVRNLASFNEKVDAMGTDKLKEQLMTEEETQASGATTGPSTDWFSCFELDENGSPMVTKLPFIVIIIDELADLMMIAKKEVETSIARIAQKARAAGIHLVIATQRPSTDVVTGLIKANLPSRVSFRLTSNVDSRTILDQIGAERLLGQGDMLFIPPGSSQSLRLHGAYLSDGEIEKVTSFLKAQGKPAYREEILQAADDEDGEGADGAGGEEDDELFQEAVTIARLAGQVSTSYLQRRMSIGYNRAARIVDQMESRGIVGPADGAKPRPVLLR